MAFVVIIQLFQINKTNPVSDPKDDFITITNPPEHIQSMLLSACYDCHSHKTMYPWYTSVTPLNFWIKRHIDEGRDELNFSKWGEYSEKRIKHKLEEAVELVEENEMPLKSYTIAHSDARLSDAQRAELVSWFRGLNSN